MAAINKHCSSFEANLRECMETISLKLDELRDGKSANLINGIRSKQIGSGMRGISGEPIGSKTIMWSITIPERKPPVSVSCAVTLRRYGKRVDRPREGGYYPPPLRRPFVDDEED
jgi:hypothetical protein